MRRFILSCLVLGCIQISHSQTLSPQLTNMLQDTLTYYTSLITNIKGMSASVYLPGQGMWKGVSGVSHAGVPINSNMEFGIASNTKLFVATVMLKLAENNQINLDAAIGSWLPAHPNINSAITVRQLLNHTSGISDPLFVAPYMDTINNNADRVFSPEEVLGWVGTPQFAAGSGWGYSNINYVIAGMIAENITGFHISKLIRDSILIPLNMDSTFYDVQEPWLGTVAHRWWNLIDYNDTSTTGLNTAGGAAGAIYSTSGEMAQWYAALFSGQIINQQSLNELTTFVATPSPTYDYGLGLSRETTQNHTYWGHGGRTWGYRSKMIYDDCMNAVVCGLTNSDPSGMDGVTFLLYRVLLNHLPACSGVITGNSNVCQEQNTVTYTIAPIARASSYEWIFPSGFIGTSTSNSITVNIHLSAVSGEIIVRGVNSYGKGGESTLFVQVNPLPETPSITLIGNTLHSSSINGNQWYNQDGIIIDETSQDFVVNSTGIYYVIVSELGCSSANSNSIQITITDLIARENDLEFKFYPNPVGDELVVESKGIQTEFEISDSAGKLMMQGTIKKKEHIDVRNFDSGIYCVRLTNNNRVKYFKFIK